MSQSDFVCFGQVKKDTIDCFRQAKACINYIDRVNDLLNRIQVGSPAWSVNSILLFGPESSSVALAAFIFITIHITLGSSHIANVKLRLGALDHKHFFFVLFQIGETYPLCL